MGFSDVIDRFADDMNAKYDTFDNFANKVGLDHLYQNSQNALQKLSPQAADAVDSLLGSAKVALDDDGDGHIDFHELTDPVNDVLGLKKNNVTSPQDLAKQLELNLRLALLDMQLQLMTQPWTGFNNQ